MSVIRAKFRPSKSSREQASAANEETLRLLEAILFASAEPLDEDALKKRLPANADVKKLLAQLAVNYGQRGINLTKVAGKWAIRTATDLGPLMSKEIGELKKLSRAAVETLAIVAYHQPVTRAEIEEIRGVTISKGTLDLLIETGWVRLRGRRRTPGRPVTYGTTEEFLVHFGFEAIDDLPGLEELKGAGFLEGRLPTGFSVPMPNDDSALRDDEEALEPERLDLSLAPEPEADKDDALEEPSEPPRTRYDRKR